MSKLNKLIILLIILIVILYANNLICVTRGQAKNIADHAMGNYLLTGKQSTHKCRYLDVRYDCAYGIKCLWAVIYNCDSKIIEVIINPFGGRYEIEISNEFTK